MFTDIEQALEAGNLDFTPLAPASTAPPPWRSPVTPATRTTLPTCWTPLGLPCAEGDLVRLLPHPPSPHTPAGDSMTVNAFTAAAASMLENGDSPEHVRNTLGLSESELTEAVQHAARPATTVSGPDRDDSTSAPQAAATASDCTAEDADGIESLLSWAENHPAAGIRNRAARVRAELTERRTTDAAHARRSSAWPGPGPNSRPRRRSCAS